MDYSSIRSSKWFKPALIGAGALALLIIVLLVLPALIDVNNYRGQITSQLEQRLGRKVSLGALSLSVFPSVKIGVDQAAIGDDPQFAKDDFIKAKSIRLQIGLGSLLRGKPQVGGLELTEPEVVMIKEPGGKWNWGTLKPLQSAEPQAAEMAPFDLIVRNGRFTMVDRTVSPPGSSVYTGVDLALDHFSPRSAFDFVISISMPGEKPGELKAEGTAGPIDPKNLLNTPLDARIKTDQVEITALEALAGLQTSRRGRLTLDLKAKGRLSEELSAQGTLAADQLRLVANVEPPRDRLETSFKLKLKALPAAAGQNDYRLELDEGEIKLGKTAANVSGTVNQLINQPAVDLQIKGDRMALDSLLESAYAFGFGPPKGTTAAGTATLDLRASGPLSGLALNGQAAIQNLKFQSAGLPQPIQISELKLGCDPSAITVAPFRTTLGSRTTVEINALKLTDYSKKPRLHLEMVANNAQLDDLISIAESFGARPDVKGTGVATLKATVETGLGSADKVMNMNGQGKLSQARIQTSALRKPLEIGNADLTFTGNTARIENLSARLGQSQADGWVQIVDFDHPQVNFDLRMNQLNVTEIQQIVARAGLAENEVDRDHVAASFTLIPRAMAQTDPPAPATKMNLTANGQIAIGQVIMDNLSCHDLQSKVALKDQILTLDPLSLKLYGGGYQGKVQVDQRQAEPLIALNGRIGGVDVNQLLSALMGEKSVVYGRSDATVNLRGRGRGGDQFLNSLAGNGNLLISDGKITSFDLMKQVEVFGKLAGLPTGGAGTAFKSLKTNFQIDHGNLRTNNLQIIMDDLQVTGDGSIQLGNNMLANYDILAKLSPALSKRFAGGEEAVGETSGIGKYIGKVMSVAGNFFMEGGSIVVPLKMSGPIKQPQFSLNAAVVQKRATERFLPKPGEKIDASKPEETIKGLIDIFKKKKKP